MLTQFKLRSSSPNSIRGAPDLISLNVGSFDASSTFLLLITPPLFGIFYLPIITLGTFFLYINF